MRLVLDTNVLIAALISRGFAHEVFEHCAINHTLVTSTHILQELQTKLIDRFGWPRFEVDEAVELVMERSEITIPASFAEKICRDPDDDVILGTAFSGNCRYIITGDRDLLELGKIHGVIIVTPRQFFDAEAGT